MGTGNVLQKPQTRLAAVVLRFYRSPIPVITQALAKNANNYKAMFRKGKALGEQGFFEKAVKILDEVKEKNPTGKTRPYSTPTYHPHNIYP